MRFHSPSCGAWTPASAEKRRTDEHLARIASGRVGEHVYRKYPGAREDVEPRDPRTAWRIVVRFTERKLGLDQFVEARARRASRLFQVSDRRCTVARCGVRALTVTAILSIDGGR